MNLLLIDSRVPDSSFVASSLLPTTQFVLFDFQNGTLDDLKDKINSLNVDVFSNVGIFQHNHNKSSYEFVVGEQGILDNVRNYDKELQTWKSFKEFIKYLVTEKKTTFLDLISCNIFANFNWRYVIEKLQEDHTIKINASSNTVGYSGNWILDYGAVDLTEVYFTEAIKDWRFDLAGSTISTSTTLSAFSGYSWPITISGGTVSTPTVISIDSPQAITTTSQYFIVGSPYVTINGGNNTLYVSGVTNYPGLVQNGNISMNSYDFTTVQNIVVDASTSTLLNDPSNGWIAQRYFKKGATNNYVINCSQTATTTKSNIVWNKITGNIALSNFDDYYWPVTVSGDSWGNKVNVTVSPTQSYYSAINIVDPSYYFIIGGKGNVSINGTTFSNGATYGSYWSFVPPSKLPSGVYTVHTSSTGQYVFANSGNPTYGVSTDYGVTWTQYTWPTTNSNNSNYDGATSGDGKYVLVGFNGGMWYSTNYGVSFTNASGSIFGTGQRVNAIGISYTGQYAVAVYNNNIYYSNNYGVNWTKSNALNVDYRSCSMSSSGQYVIAGGNANSYYSADYGVNWTISISSVKITACSLSANSGIGYAVDGTTLYKTNDYGVTWSVIYTLVNGLNNPNTISTSSDGTKVVCVDGNGVIYTSSNSGVNWYINNQFANQAEYGTGSAMSADGTRVWVGFYRNSGFPQYNVAYLSLGTYISVQNVQNYPGLVQNGTATSNGLNNVLVQNMLMDASSSTLANPTQNGWYAQRYFQKRTTNVFVGNVSLTSTSNAPNTVYNTINGNTTIADQFDDYCWPITISGDSWGNKTSVTVTNPITLVDASHYFIIGRGNVTLDGQSNTFSIPNVTNYTGLVQNGNATINSYNNVTVQNIVVDASTSTLLNDPSNGWIAQRYFKKGVANNYVFNCSKTTATTKNDVVWNKITGNIALSNFDDYYWPVTVSGDSWGNKVTVNIISASGNYNSINIVDPSCYFIVGGKGNVSLTGSNFALCTTYGSSWIQSSGGFIYECISMSNSGQYSVVATSNGGVRYSTNYGITWTTSTNVQAGSGIAHAVISGNGLISFSMAGMATMYYSTNSGVSYVASSFSIPTNSTGLSISYTGQYGIVCGNGGYIYYSNNYGVTWTQANCVSASWWSCAISQTTGNAIACVNGGLMYFSNDYGGSWYPSNAINGISLSASWQVCGLSSDGSGVGYAAISQGQVYKTYNFGKTWALLPNSIGGSIVSVPYNVSGQIAMSSNGQYVLLGNGTSFVFASTDGGNSWKQIPFPYTINTISMSSNGQYAVIATSSYNYYMNNGSQISIQNITNYPGLIQNGTETTSGQSNISVQNIVIDASSSTLANSSQNGWIFQRYIKSGAKNVYVNPNNTFLTPQTTPNTLAYNTIYGNVTLSDFNDFYWPLTVSGDAWNNKTTVSIANPITIIDASAYFIIGRGNVTIDGQSNLLSITNVSGYAGFVQNGNISMNGYNNVTVQNVIIDASTSTLLGDPSNGWVAQRYFQKQTLNTFVINSSITTTTTRNSAIWNTINGNTVLSHFDDYVFPVTISGDSWNNQTVVTVSGPINIVDASHYFIVGRKNIRMQNNQPVYNALNGTGTTTWVSTAPNNYFWYDVTMSSTGQYVIAANSADNNTAYTLWYSSTYGLSWYQTPTGGTNSNMSGGYNWRCVTMTPTASIAYAAAIKTGSSPYGQIYICTTLTINNPMWRVLPNSPFDNWRYMATSENGQVILASTNGGYLYLSINGGTSWTTFGSSTFGAVRVAVSTDGTKLLAAQYNAYLWVSTNMGATWSQTGTSGYSWQTVAMTPTGSMMYAATAATSLYYSSNYGVNWQTYPNCPVLDYRCVSVSSDGTKIVLPQFNGAFYTSTDSGNTWTTSNNYSSQWMGVAMSYNGQTVIIVGGTSQNMFRYNFFPTYINICNVQNYPGLIQNGTATTNAYGNVYLQNMFIDASSSTVATNNGWIAQQYFQKGPSAVGIFVTGTLFTASTPNPRVGYSTINGNIALSNFDDYLWPVTVSGDSWNNKTTVSLTSPITIIDASHHFIIGQGNVTIDGQSNVLSITNVSGYAGLVQNGNVSLIAYSNVTVQNITVDASTSTLLNDPSNGWIAQRYFKKRAINNYVINCSKTTSTTKNDIVWNAINGNITLSNFDDYYWPITVSGDSWENKVTVTVSGSVTIVDPSSYFIIGGKGNVTINSTQSTGRKLTDNFAWNAIGYNYDWRDVAMNSTGQYGIAGRYGSNMYYTSNFGTNWVASTSMANWIGVTMSQTGQYAMSVSYNGKIWLSTSYGVFWSALSNSPTQYWSYIGMSSNGQTALASVTNGYLYYTTNMGTSWTQCGISANWNNVKISGDGTKAVVCTENAQLYYSTNSFATFTPTSVSAYWRGLDMSTDGTKVLAGAWSNGLYFSTNSGVTFAQCPGITGTYQYRGAAISDDGQTMIAAIWGQSYNSGSIIISTNAGNTFFSNTLTGVNQQFWGLALSRDNRIVFSPSQSQNLYVFQKGDTYTSISGINNYPGFIQNGTSTTDAYNNVAVNGLVIDASTSTLNSTTANSWIMQRYFQKNAINITASGDSLQPYTVGLALPNVIYGNTSMGDFTDYFWPITISGDSWGNKTTINLTANITIADASHYFIIGQGNVSINGGNNTLSINSVTKFPGLVQNGTSTTNAFNNVTVNNIIIDASTSTLANDPSNGWIAQRYFKKGATGVFVNNCSQTTTTTKNNVVWNSIVGNIAISSSNIDDYCWPLNIGGDSYGNYSTITLSGSFTIIDPSYYFVVNNNYVNVSGNYYKLPLTSQTMVQTSSTSSAWWKVASSYSGQYAIATLYGGYVYYSNDYGNTWTAATNTGGIWCRGIAMSSSGQYAVMNCYNNGYMYYSSNYGQYWSIAQSYANANYQNTNWNNVAMSSSGQYVYAMSWGWYPSYSTNYGVNWTQMATSQFGGVNSYGIATSSNGQYVAFSSWGNSGMFVSSNYGTSFVTIAAFAINGQWGGISMSSSGQYMVSATGQNNGYIYYSSNYGLTWLQSNNSQYINWWDCAMDQTGQYCVAAPMNSYLYFSSSYGVYWQQFTTFIANWQGVTITTSVLAPSGAVYGQIIAVCNSGYIYRSNFNGNGVTISNVTNYGGLIQNGTATTNAYNNIKINTLLVDAPTSTLYNVSSNGWILQKYFKKGITTAGSVTFNNVSISSGTQGAVATNTITGNTKLDSSNFGDYIWPVNVAGDSWGNKTTVSFGGKMNIIDASNYFVATAGNVTIDGQNNLVTVNSITNYPGLVQNGTSTTNGFNNIVVQNITIDASSSTLANDPSNGWIAQRYFKKGATGSFVNNCSQTVTTTKNNVVWNSILGNITLTSSNLNDYCWPVSVSGDSWGNKTVVTVSGPMTIIDPSYYFNIVANNVCISGNYVQSNISTNFIQRSPPRAWSGIAISSTGQYSVGVIYGGTIFSSSNYGVTWSESASAAAFGNLNWTSVCMSSDGTKCVAAVQNGYLYYSANYGITWTLATTPSSVYNWYSVCMSSDGNTVYACVDSTYVFKSANAGVGWSQSLSYGWGWRSIVCSSNAQYVVVTSGNGTYYSINSGSTWAQSSGTAGYSVSMSTDGSIVYCQSTSSGYINGTCFIYISTNYGVSFYQNILTNTIPNVSSISYSIGNIYTIGNGSTVYMTLASGISAYNSPYLISTNYGVNFTIANSYVDTMPVMGYGIIATNSTSNMIYTSRGFCISTANNLTGSGSLISINRVSNYAGLIQNGNSKTGISVTNIGIDASSSTLNNSSSNGWILQSGFENGLSTLPTLTNLSITSGTPNGATPIIYGNININNSSQNYVWPITIGGDSWGNKTTVSINSPMNITDASQYFIISRGNVTIDGLSNQFSISNVTKYPGLVQNGTATANGYNNVSVQNITVDASTSTLLNDPSNGWIAQRYFKKNATGCYVINCSQTATTTKNNTVWNKITGNIALSNFDDYYWPVTVSGDSWGNKTVVTVSGPITIYDASAYFVMGQGNIAINGNCSLAYSKFAQSWNIVNDNSNRYWNGVAVSRSGTYIYAVEYQGYIWASSNSGANWYTITTQPGLWSGIATSATGQFVVASLLQTNSFGGYVYTNYAIVSSNYGASWSNGTSLSASVYSVTMSATGQYVYAFLKSSNTWISTNYGVSFYSSPSGGASNAYGAVSDDGAAVILPTQYSFNYLYSLQTSTFYNSTGTSTISFSITGPYTTQTVYHLSVCVSGSGSTSFSAGINTQIFRSTDCGSTYYACANSPTALWNNMACSSDGTKIAATQFPGYIYYSTDTGNTWNQTASYGYWTSVSMNSDGTNIIATQMNGKLYQSSFSNGPMISISNVTNYPGLVQNGSSSSNGFNNITVNNIIVDASTSTLATSNGWITQSYFKKAATGSYVNNCGQTSTTSSNYVNNSIIGNTAISSLYAYYWPLTISGDAWGNQTTVTLPNSSMTVIDPSYYFIIGGNNISVNGNNQTITYSNVSNYPGLFQNGSVGVAGYNNIAISNLTASQTNSTLSNNAGWITQRNFEKNVSTITLTNLTATSGNISYSYANTITGNTTITNFNSYDWPVSVNGDAWNNRTTITLSGSSLTVVDPSTTFIINNNNVIIDGSGNGLVSGAAFATNNFKNITSGLPQDSATSWTHCAVSNTGQYQTMVSTTKGIYSSTTYGTNWTASTSLNGPNNATSYSWTGIIMNRSGQYQIANPNSGSIMWYSTNYGVYWLTSTTTLLPTILTAANYGFTWYSTNLLYIGPTFSTSDNGQIQVYNNTISFNGGFTFCSMRQHLNISTTSLWGTICGVAVSSSGKNITITGDRIYTSSDYGNTFFNTYKFNYSAGYMASTPSSTISFGGSAMSANGQLQLVGTQYNLSTYGAALGLYYSTDYGFNWTQINPSFGLTGGAWRTVALSGNGSYGLIGAYLANSFYGAWSFSLPNSVVISIPSIKNYSGLIQNGTSTKNGYGNVLVRNIIVDASSSTLYNSTINGWIATPYFKSGAGNAYVNNVEIAKYTANAATTSIIYGNLAITDSNKDTYLWPITISGDSWGNKTVVTLNSQINIVDASYYFIIGQGNVLIDGQSNKLTIGSVTSYPGLVRNGTAFADAFSNVTVQNIVIDASSSTLMNDPSNGWIAQRYFKKNATNAYVNNCSQTTTTTKNNIVWNSITGNISLSNFDDYYWPVSVSGDSWGNKTSVTLNGPILVYDPSSYFIAVRGNVAITGTASSISQNPLPFSINFVNVQNYPGLIQNGTASTNGYNNVTSQSIYVRPGWSTLASGTNTWITQNYFKNGATGSYAFDSSVNNIYTNTNVYIPTYRYGSISYDGRYMVGTMQNNVVMSTNYGLSWNSTIIPNNNSYNNYYNSMSYNGQYMFVNNGAGYNDWGFVLSTDYGTTWYNVPYFVEGSSWYNSTVYGNNMGSSVLTRPYSYQLYTTYMSGNGQYMFVTSGPAIYMSTNYGSIWSRNVYYPGTGLNGLNFAVNYTGQYQLYYVNISGVGNYYLSSNYGTSFSVTNSANTTTGYTTCAISYSGQYIAITIGTTPYLYAGGKQVFMYISNNYGITWTPITSANGLTNLYSTYIGYTYATMDSTGQYMAVALTNNTTYVVYVSNNYGQTWRTLQSVFGSTAPSSFTSLYTIVISGNAQYILFPSNGQTTQYMLNTNAGWAMPGLASNNIITGNTTITDFDSYYWPLNISGDVWGNPTTVTLGANQTIIDASYYFVVGSNNVNINGGNYTITIGNVSAYPGLVQNGTASTNGFNNLSISNINVSLSGTSALSASTTGWIGQRYIQKNAINVNITNCTVTPTTKGNIAYNTIFGSNTLQNFDDFYWPVTVSGGTYNTPAVICLSNVLITDTKQYFVVGSPYITIDGSVNGVINSVVVGNVINYPGLIQNGNAISNGYGNTIVRNITMNYIGNSTLVSNAGWLGQSNFAKGVYSTTSIINCSGSCPLLPPTTSNTTITSSTLSNYLFPISVGSGTTLTFGSDISFSSASQIIQIGGADVTIDGGSYNVTIGNVVNYPGLIQNGSVTKNMNLNAELPLFINSAYGNVTIKNINMKSFGNTKLVQHGGWIGQQYFGTNAGNITIQNCTNYAPIDNSFGAGIVGSYVANYGGNVTINKCNNYGNINANYAGSIVGAYAAYYGGKVLVTDCSNTGNLYYYSTGGMFSTWNPFSTNPVITGNVAVPTINQKVAIQSSTKYWNISIQNGQANIYQ